MRKFVLCNTVLYVCIVSNRTSNYKGPCVFYFFIISDVVVEITFISSSL